MNEPLKDAGTTWNEELIKAIFWEEEGKVILIIPLERTCREDKIIWALTKNGLFTVKSAYYAVLNQQGESLATSSNVG